MNEPPGEHPLHNVIDDIQNSALTMQGPDNNLDVKIPCNAPAPLVANGTLFVGCQLTKGHDGQHKVEISWSR